MGRHRVQGPDGRIHTIDAPDGASPQQILAFAEASIGYAPPAPVAAPAPARPAETNFLKDTAGSFISGVGQLFELPAQLYGLASGDFQTAYGDLAHSVTKYGDEMKSQGLRDKEAAAQARIAAADKEGFWSGVATGLSEYVSDPSLLASGITETIPSLFGTAGVGGLARVGAKKLLGRELAEQAAVRAAETAAAAEAGSALKIGQTAAERAVQRAGVAGGVGFGAVQQGADVGTDTYVRAMQLPDQVWAQNPDFMARVEGGEDPNEVKADMALTAARESALAGAGVSALTAGVLPGTFEKAVLGKTLGGQGLLSRVGKGFLGEAAQEAGEEGGGALAKNIALQQINPEQALLEGVGSQAAIAGLLGGVSGAGASGAFGRAAEAAPALGTPPAPEAREPSITKFPVTSPPSGGLAAVLGDAGSTINVTEEGANYPYTFGGMSDEGHVILIDDKGDQVYADPASLEGIVSRPAAATPPVSEAAPEVPVAGVPIGEEPVVEAPTPVPGMPSPAAPEPAATPPVFEAEPSAPGVPPVAGVPIGEEPAGIPPVMTPPDVGAEPVAGAEPFAGPEPVAEPGPVAEPEPIAGPGEDIAPDEIEKVFSREDNLLANQPRQELSDELKKKKSPLQAITYMSKNAQTPFHRRVSTQIAGMMRTLQSQGYKFNFKVVRPQTKPVDFFQQAGLKDFKKSPNTPGQVLTYGSANKPGYSRSDIMIKDMNFPGAYAGTSDTTVIHEFVHAGTAALVAQYDNGKISKDSRVGKAIAELSDLQKQVKQYYLDVKSGKVDAAQKTMDIVQGLPKNAFLDVHELLANGLTDWRMQHLLKQIEVKKVNGFTAFVRAIGKMLGLSKEDTNGLRRFLELSEELLPSDAKRRLENAQLAMGIAPAQVTPVEEEEPGVAPAGIEEEAPAPVVTEDDVQAATDDALDNIVVNGREEGDAVIADAAEPTKQVNDDRLDLQMEKEPVQKFSPKAIAKRGQVMPPVSPAEDAIGNIGMIGSFLTPASALARMNKYFRVMFDTMNDKLAYRNLLMSRPEKLFSDITRLPQESKDKLNQVMEYLRLSATELKERPKKFSIETEKLFRDNKYVEPALSKPGDKLSLTEEETDFLYRIRDYLDETYTLNAQSILQAVGYDGVYSLEAIQSLPDLTAKEAKNRDSFLKLFNAIESQRVTSYIPFMRGGDYRVIIKQKVADANGKEKTELAAFYMLDSNQWLREIVGPTAGKLVPDRNLEKQLEEIRKKYPASEGYEIAGTRLAGRINDKLQLTDLPTLDKLVSLMNANSGKAIKDFFDSTMGGLIDTGELDQYSQAYAEQLAKGYISDWPDQVREILMKQIAAGFMKQSQNIAGYDTNLVDKLFDYNRIVATTISHRRYRPQYSKALDDMKANHAPDSATLKYALAFDKHADTPEHVFWRGARAVGFYNAMWGSFSSSMVNAMSMWTLVAPQMMVMDGSAVRDVYKNSAKLVGAIGLDKDVGAYINVDKIRGMSADEREALNWAYQTGVVRAQINPELMGMDAGLLKTKGGKIGQTMKRYFDIGASVVSVTEEMNKVAAFMTAYKYANNPKALQNWKEAFANNERAKAIMERGSDPRDVAAFMTETTTFIGGQLEKPPILRGFGGVAFQFSQYPLQVAHLMYQNFAKMGPRGKQAGLFTLLTMFSVSGLLFAIPFGDDAINIFEWLTEQITGKKRDFRLETQQMLVDIFGGDEDPNAQQNAEALLYGPMRALTGLNIGERIGFTSMLPELNNPLTAIPALSGSIAKWEEFKNRKPDQPLAAYTALLSPVMGKGMTDVMRGLVVFPEEGYRTQFGSNIKSPEDITGGEMLARSLGFQSADIARLVRAKRAGEDINTGTAGAERANTRRLAKMLADAIRAERTGNQGEADALREEFNVEVGKISDKFTKAIEGGDMANGVKPPSSEALREAVMFDLYPEMRINSYGKLKRRAILDARRDLLMSGEEDFPEMVEDQDQFDAQFEEGE